MAFAQLTRPLQKMDVEVKIMLIKRFEQLQQERHQAFKMLEETHKLYLTEKPTYTFEKHQKVVADITQDFKRIKQEVRSLIIRFRHLDDTPTVTSILFKIQDKEESKMLLTSQMYMHQQKSDMVGPPMQATKISKLDEEIAECEKQLSNLCITLST